MWGALVTFLRSWGLIALLIAGGLGIAWKFVAPPPSNLIRFATGPGEDSAYSRTIRSYGERLAREGFRIETRSSNGSVENLELLRRGEVDLALVQGGVADPAQNPGLVSLGAVFFEPAWLFARRELEVTRITRLRAHRIAIGPEGSGTRVLALAMLAASGIPAEAIIPLPETGAAAATALLEGRADAAFLVSGIPGPGIMALVNAADRITLLDFAPRAAAYATAMPYLTPVVLPRSALDLPDDLPASEVTLLAPAAAVIAHERLNPNIATLLVRIMQETHRGRQLFATEGRFPNGLNQDLPLHPDAQRAYERGPPLLQAWMPFWAAVAVDRLWVLIIPLVTLVIPLIRFAPPLYAMQMEGRVFRHYRELRAIDAARDATADPASLLARLSALEAKLATVSIPAAYAHHLYRMRRDIAWLRDEIQGAPRRT